MCISTSKLISILITVSILGIVTNGYEYYPSIITFNDKYIAQGGLSIPVQEGGDRETKSHLGQILESRINNINNEEVADYVLPLCCDMVKDDVISFQCQNSLATTPKEIIFKRKVWIPPKHLVSTKQSTKFKLESSSLKCRSNKFTTSLPLQSSSSFAHFSTDGYFKYHNEYFRPDEYCLSGLNEEKVEVQVCRVNCTDPMTPCIQKCCGRDQIYSFGYGNNPRGCVDSPKTKWYPTLYHNLDKKLSNQEIIQLNPHIVHKFPTSFKYNCRFNKTTVFPHGKRISDFLTSLTQKHFRNLPFRMRKDGWLLYPSKGESGSESLMAKQIENYCIEGAQDYGESTPFSNLEGETVLFLCSGGVDEAFDMKKRPLTVTTSPPKLEVLQKTTPVSEPETFSERVPEVSQFQHRKVPEVLEEELEGIERLRAPDVEQAHEISEISGEVEGGSSSIESGSSSVEIEIETDNSVSEGGSVVPFIPAVLKIGIEMPTQLHPIPQPVNIPNKPNLAQILKKKPALAQTTFNHNNNNGNDSEQNWASTSFHKNTQFNIPTCCNFSPDVNDGFTHHCRNRRMELVANGTHGAITYTPTWNVPPHFMSSDKTASFSLRSSPVTCGPGKFQFQGFIHNFEQERAKTPGEKKHGILSDGFLKYDNEFYGPDEYCVNGMSPRIVEILVCKPDCSMWENPCIQKCCALDEIYNLGLTSGNRGCQPLKGNEAKFNPQLFQNMNTPLTSQQLKEISPHFVQKYPPNFQNTCYNKITLAFPFSEEIASKLTPADSSERGATPFKHLNFRFRKDGKLMYSYPKLDGTSFDSIYDRGEFCVDAVRDYGEDEPFSNHENQTILFICASEPRSNEQSQF